MALNLYYTVTSGIGDVQYKPHLSLGLYKSGTLFKNDDFGNLFGELSLYSLHNNKKEYIALVLSNETGNDITGLRLWFNYNEKCYSKIKVSSVDFGTDAEGNLFIEHVSDKYASPVYADFQEANGEENAYNIGDIANGEYIGLWFQRELLRDIIVSDFDIDSRIVKVGNKYEVDALATEDSIQIIFDW